MISTMPDSSLLDAHQVKNNQWVPVSDCGNIANDNSKRMSQAEHPPIWYQIA